LRSRMPANGIRAGTLRFAAGVCDASRSTTQPVAVRGHAGWTTVVLPVGAACMATRRGIRRFARGGRCNCPGSSSGDETVVGGHSVGAAGRSWPWKSAIRTLRPARYASGFFASWDDGNRCAVVMVSAYD
jgi:hypothetical protein